MKQRLTPMTRRVIVLSSIIFMFVILYFLVCNWNISGSLLFSYLSFPRSERPPSHPQRKNLTFLNMDFHPGCSLDLKVIYGRIADEMGFNLVYHDWSMASYCIRWGTCIDLTKIKVLTRENAFTSCNNPQLLREQFYKAYLNDTWMDSIDAFICTLPPAMCSLFLPFNRTIILQFSMHWGQGITEHPQIENWRTELLEMKKRPNQYIISTNHRPGFRQPPYDEQIKGINNVHHIPNLCEYVNATQRLPLSKNSALTIALLERGNAIDSVAVMNHLKILNSSATLVPFSDIAKRKTGKFDYQVLADNARAIIMVPWGPTLMTSFELHTMNTIIITPSQDFCNRVHGAMFGWGTWIDWLNWKGVLFYNSWVELAEIINRLVVNEAYFRKLYEERRQEILRRKYQVHKQWKNLFVKVFGAKLELAEQRRLTTTKNPNVDIQLEKVIGLNASHYEKYKKQSIDCWYWGTVKKD